MKILSIFTFALFALLSISLFAEKKVVPSRMGKVGTPHQNSWRVSDSPDQEGIGKIYNISILVYDSDKDNIASFDFKLNEKAKDLRNSFSEISTNAVSEKCGSTMQVECLKDDGDSIKLSIEFKNKKLLKFVLKDKLTIPLFGESKSGFSLSIKPQSKPVVVEKDGFTFEISAK